VFDEFIREVEALDGRVQIPIEFPLDEKGYFDRKCPDKECEATFKFIFDYWRDKVPDNAARCHKCGRRDDSSAFNTADQQQYVE
jgi:hypothetical protein